MARKVKSDDDAPEITAEIFAKMRPMKEVTPGLVEAIKALRGRPRVESPKQVVSIRLSAPALARWSSLSREQRSKLVASFEKKIVTSSGHAKRRTG
jgi:hypothetical protein